MVDGDRQVRDIGQLERQIPVPGGIDEARRRMDQKAEPAEMPYGAGAIGSKYQGQRGPTPSRYWQNFAG